MGAMTPRIVHHAHRIDRSRVRAFGAVVRMPYAPDLATRAGIAVAERTGIALKAIMRDTRERQTTYARHLLMFVLADVCKIGVVEIGRHLGRDHSTVAGAIARIRAECSTRWQTQADVAAVREKMREAA